MNRPHAMIWRLDDTERLCASCDDWFPVSDFYTYGGRVRSWCKACLMASIVIRKRIRKQQAASPAYALQAITQGWAR